MTAGIEVRYRVSRASPDFNTKVFDADVPHMGFGIEDMARHLASHPYGSVGEFQEDVFRAASHWTHGSCYSLERSLGHPIVDGVEYFAGAIFRMKCGEHDDAAPAESSEMAVLIPYGEKGEPVVLTKGIVGSDDVRHVMHDLYRSMLYSKN